MRWRRTPKGLACDELVELVTAYLEDALSPADRTAFEAHLEECEDCAVYVTQFVQTVNALGALPGDALEDAALETLLRVFRGAVLDR
jgi:anti-sigma factor RsiW